MADATFWNKRVVAWRDSGQTAAEYCKQHGLGLSALRYWSRRSPAVAVSVAPCPSTPIRMVRIERIGATPEPMPPAPPIAIGVSGARILVVRGVDAATLSTVLEALRAGGGR